MRLLIFGDIYGRNGRRLVGEFLPWLKEKYNPDFIIGNSENLTSGKGPIPKHILELKELGFDILTWGNHTFSQVKDLTPYINSSDSIQIRPANYYEIPGGYILPGKWYKIFEKNWFRLLAINLMSDVFLWEKVYNPFLRITEILGSFSWEKLDGIILDFHRETTAESYVMSMYLDGKASFVYGTHTHIQTNDEHILPGGTGMICDVGMTGALNSSIGQTYESRIAGFLTGNKVFWRGWEQDMGPGVVNAIVVDIEAGKCIHLEKVRIREGEL